jgi:threonine aldolase
MNTNNRRDFLKLAGLSLAPILIPGAVNAGNLSFLNDSLEEKSPEAKPPVNFVSDGLLFSPSQYIQKLAEIDKAKKIEPDFYGNQGATKALEEEFAKLTGKEKAIYLPSGTMANQLAIKLLNEENTKVMVPENSHIYRDEADAAQSVHNLRLIPLGKGNAYFTLKDLEDELKYIDNEEVFKSGISTVAIENPVRRANGTFVPLQVIKDLSVYCKAKGFKMHLDGARLHIASAFSKVNIKEYTAYFDTVYISLYKYLNAAGGAILCGNAGVIDKIGHQVKIHGGVQFQTWPHTSMALHYLNGIEERWKQVADQTELLISQVNKIEGLNITKVENGTNIFAFKIGKNIKPDVFVRSLRQEHNIFVGRLGEEGNTKLMVNESLLNQKPEDLTDAFKDSAGKASK